MGAKGATGTSEQELSPAYLLRSFLWMVSVIVGAILLAAVIAYGVLLLLFWLMKILPGD